MVLIRLCHLSDFPNAADLVTLIQNKESGSGAGMRAMPVISQPVVNSSLPSRAQDSSQTMPKDVVKQQSPTSFEEVLSIVATSREPLLYSYLMQDVHLVSFEPYQINLRLNNRAPKNLPKELEALLLRTTGDMWQVVPCEAEGQATLIDQHKSKQQQLEAASLNHPVVQEIITAFPGATASLHEIIA
jgi:DNA polymerase-3 subunit gamma/tau